MLIKIMSQQSIINTYLAREFDVSDELSAKQPSDTWPFQLTPIGTFTVGSQETEVYRFAAEDESYFAVAGAALSYVPVAGMELADLAAQYRGASWIAANEPVDLATSRIGDPRIPPTNVRRHALQGLLEQHLANHPGTSLAEGVYLARRQWYLALAVDPLGAAFVLLSTLPAHAVAFPQASAWRRLAVGVGQLLEHDL